MGISRLPWLLWPFCYSPCYYVSTTNRQEKRHWVINDLTLSYRRILISFYYTALASVYWTVSKNVEKSHIHCRIMTRRRRRVWEAYKSARECMWSEWEVHGSMGSVWELSRWTWKKVDKADNGKKEGISFEAPEMLSSAQGIEEKKEKENRKETEMGNLKRIEENIN